MPSRAIAAQKIEPVTTASKVISVPMPARPEVIPANWSAVAATRASTTSGETCSLFRSWKMKLTFDCGSLMTTGGRSRTAAGTEIRAVVELADFRGERVDNVAVNDRGHAHPHRVV